MAELDRVEQELGDAIGSALGRQGLMGNRWVLVTEVLDERGERALASFTSVDLRAWDSLGMLGYVLERERAAIHAEAAIEGDESG